MYWQEAYASYLSALKGNPFIVYGVVLLFAFLLLSSFPLLSNTFPSLHNDLVHFSFRSLLPTISIAVRAPM